MVGENSSVFCRATLTQWSITSQSSRALMDHQAHSNPKWFLKVEADCYCMWDPYFQHASYYIIKQELIKTH